MLVAMITRRLLLEESEMVCMLKPCCRCVCGQIFSLFSKNYTGSISGKRILSINVPTIYN